MPAQILYLLALSSPSYDELNEGIITHAQAASRMHNAGDTTGAAQQVEQALEMYAAATALAPAEPQAHITAGQFLHNVHRFDEAVEAWERAATTAAALPPQPMGGFASVADFVAGRITRSALGKASKARDLAYANGQGNLTAAMSHAAEQVALEPGAPHHLFDLATLSAVSSAAFPERAAAAGVEFEAAQQAAAAAATDFLRRGADGRLRDDGCPSGVRWVSAAQLSNAVTGNSNQQKKAALRALGVAGLGAIRAPGAGVPSFIASLRGGALYGRDGVVGRFVGAPSSEKAADWELKAAGSCELFLYRSSEAPYVPLHANLWLSEERWRGGQPALYDYSGEGRFNPGAPPAAVDDAISVVGFASASFYHAVLSLLPRLVVALDFLADHPRVALIAPAPRAARAGGATEELLRLLLPRALPGEPWLEWLAGATAGGAAQGRIVRYLVGDSAPGERLRARGSLYWVDWPPPDAPAGAVPPPPPPPGGAAAYTVSASGAVGAAADDDAKAEAPPPPTHCLTHPSALHHAREALRGAGLAAAADLPAKEGRTLVYASRGDAAMRNLDDEEGLEAALREAAEAAGLEYLRFDGDGAQGGVRAAAAIFGGAAVVAGVHGGALANLVFCRAGALVMELSFGDPFTQHYAHAATALGLRHMALPLAADERGVGAHNVSTRFVEVFTMKQAVRVMFEYGNAWGEYSPG